MLIFRVYTGNLSNLLPTLKAAKTWKAEEDYIPFLLNGLIHTTVNLRISGADAFVNDAQASPKWTPTKMIRPGGYLWCLGEIGVFLRSQGGGGTLLAFKEPLRRFAVPEPQSGGRGFSNPPLTLGAVDISLANQSKRGILLKVMGNVIRLD